MIEYNLAFYFYIFDGWQTNRAIQIHLACLKHYAHIFSNTLFILSINDTEDIQNINEVKNTLLDCGFTNIKFQVIQNTSLCEVIPFFDIILPWGNKSNSITFFGHTKGITNYDKYSKENVDNWILSMYFLSLEYTDEVEDLLFRSWNWLFYGSLLLEAPQSWQINKYNVNYSGTFFWTNIPKLYSQVDISSLPRNTRNDVEFLPGRLGSWDLYTTPNTGLGSHGLLVGDGDKIDLYGNPDAINFFLQDNEDHEKYASFKENILNQIL